MTVDELDSLLYLQTEIDGIDMELKAIQSAPPCADNRRAGEYKQALAELHRTMQEQRARIALELDRLRRFIDEMPDNLTRDVFMLRHMDGYSWIKIDFTMQERGYYYAPGSLRKTYQRYLERCNRVEQKENG